MPMPKLVELRPEDLPVLIELRLPGSTKQYILLKTKQDGLLLNKRVGVPSYQRTP
jgi:hypothetical protein